MSFDVRSAPEHPAPRSWVRLPVLTAWTAPANIGQSPPHVKHIWHATAVCALATAGAIAVGRGFPDAAIAAASSGLVVEGLFCACIRKIGIVRISKSDEIEIRDETIDPQIGRLEFPRIFPSPQDGSVT